MFAWIFDRRATRQQPYRSLGLRARNYDAIDLVVGPDALSAGSPSKVASAVPSAAAEENPTSAYWSPGDSG